MIRALSLSLFVDHFQGWSEAQIRICTGAKVFFIFYFVIFRHVLQDQGSTDAKNWFWLRRPLHSFGFLISLISNSYSELCDNRLKRFPKWLACPCCPGKGSVPFECALEKEKKKRDESPFCLLGLVLPDVSDEFLGHMDDHHQLSSFLLFPSLPPFVRNSVGCYCGVS